MAKKLFIRTFGCQMNEYDSDKMADVLAASEEIVKTDSPDDADIILFNTCSVREKAQERVFHDLGRVRYAGVTDAEESLLAQTAQLWGLGTDSYLQPPPQRPMAMTL